MSKNVYGLVTDPVQSRIVVQELLSNGFSQKDISVVLPKNVHDQHFAHEINSKSPEGGVVGGTVGGVAGAAVALLAVAGAITIPGIGALVAAGPIAATLAGIGAGGVVGGLGGALIGLGIPEVEAKQYEERIKDGQILIVVHATNDNKKCAVETLKNHNAEEVCTANPS